MTTSRRWRIVGLMLACHCFDVPCGMAAETVTTAVIHLSNGDSVAGCLADSPEPGVVAWQAPAFTAPFLFPLDAVGTVTFPVPEAVPPVDGAYCFEIAQGDVLSGSLIALDANEAVIDAGFLGTLHVDRSVLRRIYRRNGGAVQMFAGPGPLSAWQAFGRFFGWREEAGQLVSDQDGAAIRRTFWSLPRKFCMQVELSWTRRPDFELSLSPGSSSTLNSMRLEVLDDEVVALIDAERDADLKSVKVFRAGPDAVRLQLFVDQDAKRLLVCDFNGEKLAELKTSSLSPQPFETIQLTNRAGNIRLERLRINHWSGQSPSSEATDKPRVRLSDASVVYGVLKAFDSTRREFTIEVDRSEQSIAEEKVQDAFLSLEDRPMAFALRATYLTGLQISGQLDRIEKQTVWMKCPGIREPVGSPVSSLLSLAALSPKAEKRALPRREGRLELDGTTLHGCLADAGAGQSARLAWQPYGAMSPSPIIRTASARIIYRDPVLPGTMKAAVPTRIRGVQRIVGSDGQPKPRPQPPGSRPSAMVIHLRTGDRIPCTVLGVDEQGVRLNTPMTDAVFIKHEQVSVLELDSHAPAVTLARLKKERLLTVPRMQRDNPPTHLIRATTGDYLRGRLTAVTDAEIQVELRLQQKSIPRDAVSRILWLHPDQLVAKDKPADADDLSSSGTRVQAVFEDGNRLTFVADRFQGTALAGRSEALGNCRVDLQSLDWLLIGSAIEQAAPTLAFREWRLKQAIEPLAPDEGAASDGDEGRDSALVGKPAPYIQLRMLDGKWFRLPEYKDKIVVLDFWASWCGPCLQTMPQVDQVVREFADQNVELVAVNLEETPDRITAALERLKLETRVALDSNGRVAEKYGVTSIPQTVIIDREGKVVRLFVGGGARFGEQLRSALQSVLAEGSGKRD